MFTFCSYSLDGLQSIRFYRWGGFASTVCWPLSALLLEQFGWCGTAASYAAIHLFGTLPLVLVFIPRAEPPVGATGPAETAPVRLMPQERARFLLMAAMLVISRLIAVNVSVHLVTFLRAQGYSTVIAVGLGTPFGPAQVTARVVEMATGARHHPIWTLWVSVLSAACGLALLAAGIGLPGIGLVLFGAGNGLFSIARGSLPLALFEPHRYAVVMGLLARPALVSQAAAPILGASLIAALGSAQTLWIIAIMGGVNLILVALLWRLLD